jgi:hypothetical protein
MIEIKAEITGEDSAAFQPISNFSVNITRPSTAPTAQPEIELVSEQNVTRNHARIEAKSNADGYYILFMGAKGVEPKTIS